jgi:hypothetical protein
MCVASKGAMRLLSGAVSFRERVPQRLDPDAGATDRADAGDGDPVPALAPVG